RRTQDDLPVWAQGGFQRPQRERKIHLRRRSGRHRYFEQPQCRRRPNRELRVPVRCLLPGREQRRAEQRPPFEGRLRLRLCPGPGLHLMRVLLTGGAGYIGSHVAVELVAAGHTPLIVDNLVNSSQEVLTRLRELTGDPIEFQDFDLRDEEAMRELFRTRSIDACIHLAGLMAVGESVAKPLEYYRNSIESSLVLAAV